MMHRIFHIIACAIVLAVGATAQPREFKFERIGAESGLSHNTITNIHQDRRGFIWIATVDGLNRYDGYSCKVFKHNPEDSTSISSSFVHGIYEDRSGTLWFTTRDGGLNKFDRTTEQFTHFRHNPTDSNSIASDKCGPMLEDSQGRFWVGTDGGLDLFDRDRVTFTHHRHDPSNSNTLIRNEINSILETRSGEFWVGTYEALHKFDPATKSFRRFAHQPGNRFSMSDSYVYMTYEDDDGKLWIATADGVNILDPKTERFEHHHNTLRQFRALHGKAVSSIFKDADGMFWFGTNDNGLFLYNPIDYSLIQFKNDPENSSTVSHNNAKVQLQDNTGTDWIGTWGGGVNKLARKKQRFMHFVNNPNKPLSLAGNSVFALLQDRRGDVWIGTAGSGLDKMNRATRRFTHFLRNDSDTSVNDHSVFAIAEDSRGILWFGTEKGGLNRYNPTTGAFSYFVHNPNNPASLPENYIKVIYEDREGSLWLGMNSMGLVRFDRSTGRCKRYRHDPADSTSIGAGTIWAIQEDREGNLWIGTMLGGLNKFVRASETFSHFVHSQTDTQSISNNDVRSIYEDQSGMLWVGTYGGGINKFDNTTGIFESWTESNGLANNFIYSILEDESGQLWISTNKGISRFNTRTSEFKNYSPTDGLQADEFNTGAYFQNASGEMFFGGVNGFNVFHPDNVTDNFHVPPVVITSFKVFDKEVELDTAVTESRHLNLEYSQNFISFEFAALDFLDPSKNRYAYKLEGFDPDWIFSGNRHYASYTNLDPGDYVLRVKGSNNDGVWNDEGVSLSITIIPPFWMTAWFRTLALIALTGVIAGSVRYVATRKLRQHIQELEQQRALQEERERISRDLHDHTGAQLATIIAGLELAGTYAKTSTRKAKTMLDTLRDDARSGMGQLRETIWALKTNEMDVEQFAEELRRYLQQQIRYRRGLETSVRTSGAANARLSPIQILHLYRITQEAMTNALKHAKPKHVAVQISVTGKHLSLEVSNDGTKAKQKRAADSGGQGIMNMERRAHELGGTFEFSRDGRAGAMVRVVIPITLGI